MKILRYVGNYDIVVDGEYYATVEFPSNDSLARPFRHICEYSHLRQSRLIFEPKLKVIRVFDSPDTENYEEIENPYCDESRNILYEKFQRLFNSSPGRKPKEVN